MREMARRLSSTQYVLIGVLFGTCIYLWGQKLTTTSSRRQTNGRIGGIATIRSHQASLLEKAGVDDVENLIDSWSNDKRENEEVEPSAEVISERGSHLFDVQLESVLPPDVNHNITENQHRLNENEGNIDVEDRRAENNFVLTDEFNGEDVQVMDSKSRTSMENDPPEKDESASFIANGVESSITSSYYEYQSPSSILQSDKHGGIKYFPPIDVTPLTNDENKTLELLDLWNFDEKCVGFQVGLLKENTLERRALVSFPGSGNSWLRMLIQGLSGVFVNSIYPDGEDNLFYSKANSTYQVPIDCGCTLLQKTHDFSLDAMLYFLPEINRTQTLHEFEGKGILILRNPFSAILSYRNFDSGGMQSLAPEAAFQGIMWDNFVGRSVASWETLANVWIRGLKQGGIIYYEKLRHEMPTELARLSEMLGLTYNQERLDCTIRHANDNSFKREGQNSTIENPYTASQRLLIHKAIENVQAVLKERGFDPLPTQYYDSFSVVPEYGILSDNDHES